MVWVSQHPLPGCSPAKNLREKTASSQTRYVKELRWCQVNWKQHYQPQSVKALQGPSMMKQRWSIMGGWVVAHLKKICKPSNWIVFPAVTMKQIVWYHLVMCFVIQTGFQDTNLCSMIMAANSLQVPRNTILSMHTVAIGIASKQKNNLKTWQQLSLIWGPCNRWCTQWAGIEIRTSQRWKLCHATPKGH